MTSKNIAVRFVDVKKVFERSDGEPLTALTDLSFNVATNEILTIVGPSGCGKSTLLRLVAHELLPTEGTVSIEMPDPKFGLVSQNDSLFDWLKVANNLGYGLDSKAPRILTSPVRFFRGSSHDKLANKQIIHQYLRVMGLAEFENSWPRELSAGMRKRLELGRAYASDPDILLLDEAFGNLDQLTKEEMQLFLMKVWSVQPKTVLFVTHDVEEAVFLGHRVLILGPRPGSIRQIVRVPFDMPRTPEIKLSEPFLKVRQEVLSNLALRYDRESL